MAQFLLGVMVTDEDIPFLGRIFFLNEMDWIKFYPFQGDEDISLDYWINTVTAHILYKFMK